MSNRGQATLISDKGTLKIALPVSVSEHYYNMRQKKVALGLHDTQINRIVANATIAAINADIARNNFDSSLERYSIGKMRQKRQTNIEAPKREVCKTLYELWLKYVEYKSPSLKKGTLYELKNIGKLIKHISDNHDSNDALTVRRVLLELTTNSRTKKALTNICACYSWALKHNLRSGLNPYDNMACELPRYNYEIESNPNPFTKEEKQEVLKAINETDDFYLPFVEFLFLTGCRPSEAIGLRWADIKPDLSQITFNGSIILIGGRFHRNEGSKNNRKRVFPVNDELKTLLTDLKFSYSHKSSDLVFTAKTKQTSPINYTNFGKRVWQKAVNQIKLDTTPYCCRDTFISEQIAKGTPIAVIARWVDNSAQVIERYYLGDNALKDLKPL